MGLVIRKAAGADAPAWLDLFRNSFGEHYPEAQAYDPAWAATQLEGDPESETWVAEWNGKITSALSFLFPSVHAKCRIANVGRHLCGPESLANGSAAALLEKAVGLAAERSQIVLSRVLSSDHAQQVLYENAGFKCSGFQPLKHRHFRWENALFYCRIGNAHLAERWPFSDSLPQVNDLAAHVLGQFGAPNPGVTRDGITGYPLQGDWQYSSGTREDYELWKMQAQSANCPSEISGAYNHGTGWLRAAGQEHSAALFVFRNGRACSGILYIHDPVDRCVRLIDSFTCDDLSMGCALRQAAAMAAEQLSAAYVEIDVMANARRFLKAADQTGFVPVAFFPGAVSNSRSEGDVVKLVKLNTAYALENLSLTVQAKAIVDIVDQNFQNQKMGVAIINLLRALPFFEGLGEGEMRKIARLFTQKLYRPNECVFNKGDLGNEAYVVMRGEIDILLDESAAPLATIESGQIFGELAFLDGTPRAAMAVPRQPSILLVIQRSEFNQLAQKEPHLGMVVMRNIAIELSNRLRKTNEAINARK